MKIRRFMLVLCVLLLHTGSAYADSVVENINNRVNPIALSFDGYATAKQVSEEIQYQMELNDKAQWSWTNYRVVTKYNGHNKTTATITFDYISTVVEERYVVTKVTKILNDIIKLGMSDIDKLKVVNDWLVDNVAYDYTLTRHSAYDALTSTTVCRGYALLLHEMLNQLGFDNHIVGDSNHVWNAVILRGQVRYIDVTANDTSNQSRKYFLLKSHRQIGE